MLGLQVSLAGLWLMPAIISLHLKFWRFLAIWAAYSAVTGYLISLCMGKKMHQATPRKVRQQAAAGASAAV
jgi:RING finger protein 121